MSKRPAWPWLKKPEYRPAGHLNLGYYQGRESPRAVLFDYHGDQVWIPKKVLVWHSGHFMAPRWAVESSKKYQQNRERQTMTVLTYGTRLLYNFKSNPSAPPVVAEIRMIGGEGAQSRTWRIEGIGDGLPSAWLNYAEVMAGVEAYRAQQADIEADNQNDRALDRFMDWNDRAREGHAKNVKAGWWTAIKDMPAVPAGADLHGIRNDGELLMLQVSEIAEAAEGVEGGLMDDKLPHRPMVEVELADTKIRTFDHAGAHQLDLDGARVELMAAGDIPNPAQEGSIEKCLLKIVRQYAAAMEGHRKNAADRVVSGRKAFEVRLAAALMWIDATGEFFGYDVEGAIVEKEAFNAERADHKIENRRAAGGKMY